MDCDVDIARFTQHPFVIERPAVGEFADTVTDVLARAGLRLEFGKATKVVAEHDVIVSANLPHDMGLLSRTGCRINAENATSLICGEARASNFAGAAQPAISMSLTGLTMMGHVVTGPDRGTAVAYASLSGLRAGATNETLVEFASRLEDRTAGLAWNSVSRIPTYVASCRSRLEGNTAFLNADAVDMERNARVASMSVLKNDYRLHAEAEDRLIAGLRARMETRSLQTGDRPSPADRLRTELGAEHSGPSGSAGSNGYPFEARPFEMKRLGPSYLPLQKFNEESLRVVQGLHPDLLKVVARASEISGQDFQVVPGSGGMRSEAMQRKLKAKGASRAKLGRHTIGYAVDLVPTDAMGRVDFKNSAGFDEIMKAMKQASEELGIPVDWGGNWKRLVDKPHYELNRKVYPGPDEEAKPGEVLVAFK
jgi:peptidoglycan L-alanyl-D-glutamate endopeptidase CwlK